MKSLITIILIWIAILYNSYRSNTQDIKTLKLIEGNQKIMETMSKTIDLCFTMDSILINRIKRLEKR